MAERCYVYAIVPGTARLPGGLVGFGGPLLAVTCHHLAAVVSKMGAAAGTEDGVTLPPSRENLLRHEAVVEAVCAGSAALPVRFGTVLADSDAVLRALSKHYDVLQADLARLGDKIEFGVTALWREARQSELAPPSEGERRRRAVLKAAGSGARGTAYLTARLAEHHQAEALRKRAQALAEELDAGLRPHVIECRRSLCPSERLALRDVYLVEREQRGAFVEAFDELRGRHPEQHLLMSGPWPPYSFVTPPEHVPAGRGLLS